MSTFVFMNDQHSLSYYKMALEVFDTVYSRIYFSFKILYYSGKYVAFGKMLFVRYLGLSGTCVFPTEFTCR